MEIVVEDSEDRRRQERVQMYGRQLTAQQKDKRRQDNGDEKRLARHHPSDLLRSLTRERIGGEQHGVISPALRASPFRTFHVLRVRHLMRMRIPSYIPSPLDLFTCSIMLFVYPCSIYAKLLLKK